MEKRIAGDGEARELRLLGRIAEDGGARELRLLERIAEDGEAREMRLLERLEKSENNLLAAFHGWARPMEIRQRGTNGVVNGFDERLSLAEERISQLERRK